MPARTAPHLGLLELPFIFLHQLVVSLPSKSKLTLFRTCMQLAAQVVASAPSITLKFCKKATVESISSRCNVITWLLSGGREFKLVVTARGPQPFPALLSSQVTELWLEYDAEYPASPWLKWSTLSNLQVVKLSGVFVKHDIDTFCDALEAGRLPLLDGVIGGVIEESSFWQPNVTACRSVQRLFRALAPRVRSFRAESNLWVHLVQRLTILETVTVSYKSWYISGGSIQERWIDVLCNHPSVQTVWLEDYLFVTGDHYNRACRWKSLHLVGNVHLNILMQLPLPALPEVYIHHAFDAPSKLKPDAIPALKWVVDNHLNKVQLGPTWDSKECRFIYGLGNLTSDTAAIVSALKTECWLYVGWSKGKQEPDAAFVPALWSALHPSVSSVRLTNITGVDWLSFWAGIPQTVRHVELWAPDFGKVDPKSTADRPDCATQVLFRLVANAPKHVPQADQHQSLPTGQVGRRWPGSCTSNCED